MNTTKTNTTESTKAAIETETKEKINSEVGDIATRLNAEIGDIAAKLNAELGDISTKLNAEIGDIKVEINPSFRIEINPTININVKTGDVNITNCNNKNNMEDITNLVKVLLNR